MYRTFHLQHQQPAQKAMGALGITLRRGRNGLWRLAPLWKDKHGQTVAPVQWYRTRADAVRDVAYLI